MSESQTERALLVRCLRGDAAAWDELFNLHYAPTSRFVAQLGYHFTAEDVEEICQEVFLTVIRSLASFQGQSQFQTWLFRIAANRSRDYRQKMNAAKRGGGQLMVSLNEDETDGTFPVDPPSTAPDPAMALLQAERLSLIGQALEVLGDPCQEIIELRYFADLQYEEIASALALNPKTVSSRLSKCLDKLELAARDLLAREKKTPTSV